MASMIGWNGDWTTNLGVLSGPNYGDGIITGASATVANQSRTQWNIFDLWTRARTRKDEHFWVPKAERLGRGHLIRLVDSCLRLGIYPDPMQMETDLMPADAEFWPHFLNWAYKLHQDALIMNDGALIDGDFDRVYMRMLITGQKTGIGPPRSHELRPGRVQLILQPLGEYAPAGGVMLPADTISSGDPMARIKMTANYPAYLAMREVTQRRAQMCWGMDNIADAFSVKLGPGGQLLVGEASTSTIGGTWMYDGEPTVIVPHHDSNNTLVGRTAWWIMKIAQEELNLKAMYCSLTLADLFCAQELWRSGNASYLSPISAIGNLSAPGWTKPTIGPKINKLLMQAMRGEIYRQYSTLVNLE